MISDDESDAQRDQEYVEKIRKVGKRSKRPISPRKPLTRSQRISRWAMRPIKRGAEKAVEHTAAKFFGAMLFWLWLLAAMAFTHYVGVSKLSGVWKPEIQASPSATMQYQ